MKRGLFRSRTAGGCRRYACRAAERRCTFFQIPTRLRADASARQATSALPTGIGLPTSGSLPTSVVLPAGSCSIHPARPSSCAHFPYVCLIDSRGVRVTLSHYCPTAASMLFAHDGPIEILEGPPPIAGLDVPEGLDARESLPPAAAEASTSAKATADRPAGRPHAAKLRLMSWDEFSEWERRVITTSDVGTDPPVLALFELARFAVPFPWSWAEAPGRSRGRLELAGCAGVARLHPGCAALSRRQAVCVVGGLHRRRTGRGRAGCRHC